MTQEDILRMAREAGMFRLFNDPNGPEVLMEESIERFAALVAAAEREACAKACADLYTKWADELINSTDDEEDDPLPPDAVDCKLAIRARGQA